MKKPQQYNSSSSSGLSLSSSGNFILMLFCLVVAFTLGFVSSPLVKSTPAAAPNATCSSLPPSNSIAQLVEAKDSKDSKDSPDSSSSSSSLRFQSLASNIDGFVTRVQPLPDDLLRFHYSCGKEKRSLPGAARSAVIDEIFDGQSPYAGFPPPHIARQVKQHKIKGWGSDNPVFERLIRETRPKIVVELGSFLGASAIHMARTMDLLPTFSEEEHQDRDFVIFCLDDWRGWPGFRSTFTDIGQEHGNVMLLNQFLQNVAFSNLSEKILPLPFSTNTGLYKLCELGVQADLIEVDAGHDFHSAWTDINLAWSLMRPDGKSVMFGHDYFNAADYHGVRRAVDLFAKLHGLRVEPDGQHWIYRQDGSATATATAAKNKGGKRKKIHRKLEQQDVAV